MKPESAVAVSELSDRKIDIELLKLCGWVVETVPFAGSPNEHDKISDPEHEDWRCLTCEDALPDALTLAEARIATDPLMQQHIYSGGGKFRGWAAFWGNHHPALDEWHHSITMDGARKRAALAALNSPTPTAKGDAG